MSMGIKIRILGEGVFEVEGARKIFELEKELRETLEDEGEFRRKYRELLNEIRKGRRVEGRADFVLPPENLRIDDARRLFKDGIFREDLFSGLL